MVNNELQNKELTEAITSEADLMLRLTPLTSDEIFNFMEGMKKGTLFNLGQYSSVPVSAKYKNDIRIYKVIEMSKIVSGVKHENKQSVKDFRDATGKAPGATWWKHKPGWETKVAEHEKDPNKNYVIWYINKNALNTVKYFLVDAVNNTILPLKKDDVLNSVYLTKSQKDALNPKPATGIDLNTGAIVVDETKPRVAAFDHIFWLSQEGQNTATVGRRFDFNEDYNDGELLKDGNLYNHNTLDDLDAYLFALDGQEDNEFFQEF